MKDMARLKPMVISIGLVLASMANAYAAEEEKNIGALPEVKVTEKAEHAEEPGYQAKKSKTATKTDTLLRDVPQSVTVATQDLMKDQAVQNLGDVVRYTPGVGAAQGEGNRETFIFRGMSTTGDFFVDGVRDDTQYYRDLYNTERVEVLKGPNGMIFGRGGAGGVINRVSKEAGWDPIRELSLQYGSFDQMRGTLDFNQAISENAAFRLNAMYEDGNSYRDGVSLRRQGINPTITLKPSENTKITLSAEYFKDDRIADRGIPSFNGRPVSVSESKFFGNASSSPTDTEVQTYSAFIEHAFNNGITLRNRTRYADYDKFYQNVFPGNVVGGGANVEISAYNNGTERTNLFNQTDLTYIMNTGTIKHTLLAGMELGRQKTDNYRETGYFNGQLGLGAATPVTIPVSTGTTNAPVAFRHRTSDAYNHTENDIFALYLQDQLKFNKYFEAVVGLRYDNFKTDFTNKNLAPGAAGQKIDSKDDLFSPRVGLIYHPIEQMSVYTSYSETYVPRAGDQLSSLTVVNSTFDPEKYKNTEVGVKWDYNPSLTLSAAIYKLERNKFAITDPSNPTLTVLADGQETKGLELGAAGKITSAWSVAGGYAYQDAEFTKAQGNANPLNVIAAGTDVAQVPRHTFSLWNRYDFNDTWGAAIGIISRSDMYAAAPTVSTNVVLPGYTRFDAAVFAKIDKNLRLQLNVENLFDKEYYLYANSNSNITPGSPTAARLTLIANF